MANKYIWKTFSVGFFDGSCARRECGCGAAIYIASDNFYHFWKGRWE